MRGIVVASQALDSQPFGVRLSLCTLRGTFPHHPQSCPYRECCVPPPGNQRALANFLTQAIQRIQEGKLDQATDKLSKAQDRSDGCVLRGVPDGNGPGRDWITDCVAQEAVHVLIDQALACLGVGA